MKLKTILAGTALASLALAGDIAILEGLVDVPRAEAATTVSISLFYNELANHGAWVRHREAYVFIPANVRAGWRPYTDGRWVYTEGIGWTWASNEPFGWATYHYGRWGYGDDIGWYWVPGTRWAPAWVSWRRSNDHVVWAPLPPSRGGRNDVDVSVSVSVGDIPAFYWVAVPTRRFLEPNIRTVIINDDRDVRRVVQRADFIGTVEVRNNIVVNTVIDIRVIERETGRQVRRVEARRTSDPREARVTEGQVVVFEGEVQREPEARPRRVREASEVRKVRRERAERDDPAREDETGTTGTAAETPDSATTQDSGTTETTPRQRRQQRTTSEDTVVEPDRSRGSAERADDDGETATQRRQRRNTAQPPQGADADESADTEEATPREQRRRQRARDNASGEEPERRNRNAGQAEEAAPEPSQRPRQRRNAEGASEDRDDATGSTRAAPRAQDNQGNAR